MNIEYFYKYQKEYYADKSRFIIYNKSRQIGISEIAVFKGLMNCLKNNNDVLFVSSSQRQSNLIMDKVEKFIDIIAIDYTALTKQKYKLLVDSKTQKTFQNKKSIYCLPSNPETIRSFSGDVIIDEFAFHREDKKIYSSLLPVITRGYSISIISTPLGQSNMFYEIYSNENSYKDYKRFSINIYQAKEQGFNLDIDSIRNNTDEETFRQEYLCEFVDEATSYFTYELLKKCLAEYDEDSLRGKTYIGIDVGRTNDLTAISVIVEMGGVFFLKQLETLKNVSFDVQLDIIAEIIRDNSPESIYIDKGAIGMQLAETLEKMFVNCFGVNFTANFKNELVTNTKKLMEQGKFKFNEDRNIINSFHKIKRTVSSRNNLSFDSVRDSTGHSDEAWAIMLSCYQTKLNTVKTQWLS